MVSEVHALRLSPGGEGREVVPAVFREQRLRDLAAGRVARTDEEDSDRAGRTRRLLG